MVSKYRTIYLKRRIFFFSQPLLFKDCELVVEKTVNCGIKDYESESQSLIAEFKIANNKK